MQASFTPRVPGIHHVTAICGDPQRNIDFYTGLLGLRLVKKTVNFDEPTTWHLYYGDALGTPGTILTFFAWILPPMVQANARQGAGQVTAVPFRIPDASLDFWITRLAAAAVSFDGPEQRFGEQVVSLHDPDGLPLELVARGAGAPRAPWSSVVPDEHALRGFAGATLSLNGYERTAALLTATMGLREVAREGSRFRFAAGEGDNAVRIDLHCQPESEPGRMGIGAVHHIAWRAPSADAQRAWRDVLVQSGFDPTPVLDRRYFQSVYFREPGGVLFEIATEGPGFTVDEPGDSLGAQLMLPPWLEARRAFLEARLPVVRPPPVAGGRR
ncbi:MAG TPA: ring-cleaving dioxygenase [Gemmatimonadaceae bacterium]|nr:ring-cleaving dioxygenase [Gemmatimonadaceae bacterium]